ncbi:hypothetical protein RF11_13995 [Thelohanellus kitauei]|uniref:Uncharacterized protein n=1 Tax=Thelohanellus kitauei TaxID=669202 RepID=A0A0C2MH90_THEKT|nr:hypothetical protein RF11_13995 [Thelohanellus kitauei]
MFWTSKTIDLIFEIREDLGGLNVMTFLVYLKSRVNNAIFTSIIDYLMELSQLQPDYFNDLSKNTSDMKEKANDCQDIMQKNTQDQSKEPHQLIKNNSLFYTKNFLSYIDSLSSLVPFPLMGFTANSN